MSAVHGEPVDRVPFSFWLHNFARESTARELVDETLRLHRTFDWDFLKPQMRYQCFAEMWGLEYRQPPDRAEWPIITRLPVKRAADLAKLAPADPATGALADQLEAIATLRTEVGPDVPILATVFAPIMVAQFMVPGGIDAVLAFGRDDPAGLQQGLEAISVTQAGFARLSLAHGADGIFYATNVATKNLLSPDEFHRFEGPFDRPIIEAAGAAPLNVVHMCGNGILFDEFVDYPVSIFSWATTPGNPSLSEVHRRTGRAVLGGLPAKPEIGTMSADELAARARASLAEMGGRYHLLGPDCSINPDTPEALMHAVGALLRSSGPQSVP
jgi:uroporphyrinogen decarboxylase